MSVKNVKLEKNAVQVFSSFAEADSADKRFWHSQTTRRRLEALELMRQSAYGYENPDTERLQRVFEIVEGK